MGDGYTEWQRKEREGRRKREEQTVEVQTGGMWSCCFCGGVRSLSLPLELQLSGEPWEVLVLRSGGLLLLQSFADLFLAAIPSCNGQRLRHNLFASLVCCGM